MKIARAKLKSTTQYSQSRCLQTLKSDSETNDQHEQRVWRERLHAQDNGTFEDDGTAYIPAMQFKNSLDGGAASLGLKVPGRGQKTYTKVFVAGVLVLADMPLTVTRQKVPFDKIHASANGVKGGPKRVWKFFPRIDEWDGVVEYHILDETITEDVFTRTLKQTGHLVGLGRFRPANGGYYGRFEIENVEWEDVAI